MPTTSASAGAHACCRPTHQPRRVLLVDDQPAFLMLARMLLADEPQFEIVGEALSGEAALDLHARLRPDVVVLDVELPGMHGFETARRLTCADTSVQIVMVSIAGDGQYPALARDAGAVGFLGKKTFSGAALAGLLA